MVRRRQQRFVYGLGRSECIGRNAAFFLRVTAASNACALIEKPFPKILRQGFLAAQAECIFSAMGEIRHFMLGDQIDHA